MVAVVLDSGGDLGLAIVAAVTTISLALIHRPTRTCAQRLVRKLRRR